MTHAAPRTRANRWYRSSWILANLRTEIISRWYECRVSINFSSCFDCFQYRNFYSSKLASFEFNECCTTSVNFDNSDMENFCIWKFQLKLLLLLSRLSSLSLRLLSFEFTVLHSTHIVSNLFLKKTLVIHRNVERNK